MLLFILKRILAAIPVLFVLSVVTFAIIHARPGDYGDYVYSMLTSRGVSSVEAERAAEAARAQYGLNDPVPVRYIQWVKGIVTRGDFGYSFYYNRASARHRRRAPAAPLSPWRSPAISWRRCSVSASASSPRPDNTAGPTPRSRSCRSSA